MGPADPGPCASAGDRGHPPGLPAWHHFGAPCQGEVELAERVVKAYPGLEQVRFVSSGTEATMSAIRLARAATGRELIVKFSGCYHGHADHLLVAAGSGLATFGTASSAGVPSGFVAAPGCCRWMMNRRCGALHPGRFRHCRGHHRASTRKPRPASAAQGIPESAA